MKKPLLAVVCVAWAVSATAQESPLAWTAQRIADFRVVPNVTYLTASNWDAKLDLYVTTTPDRPRPTVIFIHSGGWTGGSKESRIFSIF